MSYVDGYVLALQKKNVAAYRRIARMACRVWLDHGALDFKECVGDDLDAPFGVPFPKLVKTGRSETVVFSYVVYRSRAHRDRVNARVMTDKRMLALCHAVMPFDMQRMSVGGFKVLAEGSARRR